MSAPRRSTNFARDQILAMCVQGLRFHDITLHGERRADEQSHIYRAQGTMNALFLKDLADKTRRTRTPRARRGDRAAAFAYYGYDVVADDDGVGGRVNERRAMVVRRIFRAFMISGEDGYPQWRGGLPGRAGRPWRGNHDQGQLSPPAFSTTMRSYRGELIWNRNLPQGSTLTSKLRRPNRRRNG